MNIPADAVSEQLSALMDGELSEDEARFLRRRIEADPELRAKWERLHLASDCMKGHPLRLMSPRVGDTVAAGIEAVSAGKARRPLVRWAVAASVAALALLFAPQLMRSEPPEATDILAESRTATPDRIVASPASADLVALAAPVRGSQSQAVASSAQAAPTIPDLIERGRETSASTEASPAPLSAESPADFPLVDSGEKRSWPRSELPGVDSDPSIEAYLVRHNQMLAGDGMGGFVPYVDVVASDSAASASDPETSSPDAGTHRP